MPEEIEKNLEPAPVDGAGAGDGNSGKPNTAPDNGQGASPKEGDDKGQEGDKKPEGTDKNAPGDNDEPPVRPRKTAKDFIIDRKERKIAKLQKQKGDGAGDNPADDEDDDLQEDRKLILETVEPILNPIIEKSLKQEDDTEVQDFLAKNPDFKPYEAKVRKFMQHPSRRQLPIHAIFYEVAGPDLMKIGAKRAAEADAKAKGGQTGGGSGRGSGDAASVLDMPEQDFKAMQEKVRQKQR
jgi:hypothetical protein